MLNSLKNIINNRVVFILAHGFSICELEKKIEEYKDYDICYASLNSFPMMEKFILSKINKKLNIVYDSSTVAQGFVVEYEKMRVSRLDSFLFRDDNNMWITTHGLLRDMRLIGYEPFINSKINKIMKVDDLFPKQKIAYYMSVPNSLTLLIASCMAGLAKKIILFGVDGYNGKVSEGLGYCYHPDIVREERILALGSQEDPGINRDTGMFENNFPRIYEEYRKLFMVNTPILNCSQFSVFNCIPKIDYEELKGEL